MITFEEVDKLLSYDPETGICTWKVDRGYVKKSGDAYIKVSKELFPSINGGLRE